MSETSQRVKEVFSYLLGIDESEITNTSTNNDLGMDSLDRVEAVMELEKVYNIVIPDERMDDLKAFEDYVNLVNELTTKEDGK
jgi:acyl carrier protein